MSETATDSVSDTASEAPAYRLALLADLHGNGTALRAVLEHLRPYQPYLLVIAGDLIGGPHQEELVQLLRDINALVVRGNAEDYIARLEDGSAPPEWRNNRQFAMVRWVFDHLRPETRAYLRGLPEQVTIALPGAQPVCVFHGVPGDTNAHLYPPRAPGRLEKVLDEIPGASLVCGHTHVPWMERVDGRVAVNPGAVCSPDDGQVGAQYALLDWDGQHWQPSFHRIPYDIPAFARDYARRGILATGPLARAHLLTIQRGGNVGEDFLAHAYRLTAERGYPDARFVPDPIWELAAKTFDWQE